MMDQENLFVMGWFVAGAVLNYVPTDFQIHMLNSWQIPMAVLAAKGVHEFILPAIVKRWPQTGAWPVRWVPLLLVIAVLPTNLYLWSWRFVDLARHDYPYFLHQDDVAAMQWLRDNASPEETVLCSQTIGQYVPAVSGNIAFLAHWAQTVDYYDKEERVARFFDRATSSQERAETARDSGVDYVLHGAPERALGDYDPADADWLVQVLSLPHTSVYRVDSAILSTSGR